MRICPSALAPLQQQAISKAEKDARVVIHNLNREVSLSSVSSETDKALEHAADLGNDSLVVWCLWWINKLL